jgi:DNA invertase Pin-like site-specific DNA recombinase
VKPRRLIGYTRVSTEEQARNGDSLAAQRAKLEALCAAHDHELVDVIDDGGYSGKDLRRPGLQRALRMLVAGDADGLVATKLDRLSRSIRDYGDLLAWFDDHGYALWLHDVGVDTSTAAGRMVVHIMAALAQMEREQTGERVRAVLADKKRRGEPVSRTPVAPDVRARIETLWADGYGLTAIADQLDAEGVPTARGGRWRASTIQSVLGLRKPSRRRRVDLPKPPTRRRNRTRA